MVNVVRLPSRKTKGTDATTNAVLSKTWMDWPQSYGFKRFLSPPTTSCQSAKAAEDFHVWSWTLMEHVWKAVHMWQESKNMTGIICSFTLVKTRIFYSSCWSLLSPLVVAWSHFTLVLLHALSLRISVSSCKEYLPHWRVWRRKWHCIILVNASASCAPVWTHLSLTPSASKSLMALACSCVRNSWQLGGAVRVTKSNNDLQSVTAIEGSSLNVAVAKVSGSLLSVVVAFFQSVLGFRIQLQKSLNHDSWSKVVLKDVVSADSVLVTTLWIFLQPQLIGFTGHTWFFPMSAWVVMIIVPVCGSGCFLEANDASEKARNRIWSMGIGWILTCVSLYFLASWRILFPWMRVSTVALFTSLCRKLKRLDRSGLVFTDAYWSDPISALKSCLSLSLWLEGFLVFFVVVGCELDWFWKRTFLVTWQLSSRFVGAFLFP